MDAFPAIKFFSATDQSQTFPTPITCVRVEKPVGTDWRTWAGWFKLLRYLDAFP
jgi:hypothetical protein